MATAAGGPGALWRRGGGGAQGEEEAEKEEVEEKDEEGIGGGGGGGYGFSVFAGFRVGIGFRVWASVFSGLASDEGFGFGLSRGFRVSPAPDFRVSLSLFGFRPSVFPGSPPDPRPSPV